MSSSDLKHLTTAKFESKKDGANSMPPLNNAELLKYILEQSRHK